MAWSAPVLWCALALLGGTAALQMQAELPTQASLILTGGMGLLGFVVPIAWIGAVGRRGPIGGPSWYMSWGPYGSSM